ncbi:MAG TPA: glycosyltransferase family A protein [Pyrinomonadaceae bacterium]|nr:glycosyltransferase family A protein [Pyrinomonadaceae bacterium]
MIKRAGYNSVEETPAVTVVIAAYNSARYISQALDSVKAQTFTDYEVIVVNDGSDDRDELERILESHPLSIIYLSQENGGVSAARNAAIKIASGEFYAQLDADDQWTPDYLEFQLKVLADNPDVALVYPNATIINDSNNGNVEFMKVTPSEGEVTFVSLVRQECTVMTCVTARMSAIKKAGVFDENLRRCEDFDLWVRIVKNVGRIVYHRRALALYRRHAGSLSSDRVPMVHSQLAVLEKCSRMVNLTPAEREVLDQEIHQNRGMLRLFEGKRALRAGRADTALVNFTQANDHLRSRKLVLVIFLLRHVPRLVIWTFGKRERLLLSKRRHEPPTVVETRGA